MLSHSPDVLTACEQGAVMQFVRKTLRLRNFCDKLKVRSCLVNQLSYAENEKNCWRVVSVLFLISEGN